MANLLEQGSRWLAGQQREHMSRQIVYRRGGESVTLLATPGATESEQDVVGGAQTRRDAKDWLIDAKELAINGQRIEPKRGDVIEDRQDGITYRFQVMPPPGSDDAWRWSDQHRIRYRVRTTQTGADT